MGNQQGVATEVELAWLAGMLNGDGCFSLTFRNRGGAVKCDVSVTLTQCDPCLIEKTSSILAKYGINPSIVEYAPSGAGINVKYNLRLTRMAHIRTVLGAVVGYMAGTKAALAALMLRYIDHRIVFADKSMRGELPIAEDAFAIGIGKEFYAARKTPFPADVVKALNDYPAREYGQAPGSAQHA